MKKVIAFFLSLTFVFSIMSCAAEKEKTNNDVGDNPAVNYLEDVSFEGEDIVIRFALAKAKVGDYSSKEWISCLVDDIIGETVVDNVYRRNEIIKNQLGVELEVVETAAQDKFSDTVKPVLMSGDDAYDWLWAQQSKDVDLSIQGFLYDLNKLGDRSYIDISGDWWASGYIENIQYKNELYWVTGPLTLSYAGGTDGTFVNSRIYDSKLSEKYGNIYDLVRAGDWTVDVLAEMSSLVFDDKDTNGAVSDGDVFGIGFNSSWSIMELLIGCGLECSSRSADGSLDFKVVSTNDDLIDIIQKTYNIFSSTPGITTNRWTSGEKFINGEQLARFGGIETLESFREMEDDFYLIPLPKLDKDQETYRSAVGDNVQLMGLAYTCQNIEAATATLELMAYYSAQMVTPSYYDVALKYKYTRDEEAAEMIDLIAECAYTDFVLIWEWKIWGTLWIRYSAFGPSASSSIRKSENQVRKTLQSILDKLDELSQTEFGI